MARNPRRLQEIRSAGVSSSPRMAALSARGRRWIAAGIGGVACGFILLMFTDPGGQNWASAFSPLLLVTGYAIIGIGLVIPAKPNSDLH